MNLLKEWWDLYGITVMQFIITLCIVIPYWYLLFYLSQRIEFREVMIQMTGAASAAFGGCVGYWIGKDRK